MLFSLTSRLLPSLGLKLNLFAFITVFLAVSFPCPGTPVAPSESAAPTAQFYALPMHFEPNQGQTDQSVEFLSRGPGYTVFLSPARAVVSLQTGSARSKQKKIKTKPDRTSFAMNLVGAKGVANGEGTEQLEGTVNYFVGNDPSQWHASIPVFAKVKYPAVYPGIDLIYYGSQRQLEYDFVLAPGADPNLVRIGFSGAVGLKVDESGGLVVHTGAGQVRWNRPVAYQETAEGRVEVPANFVLLSKNQVGFRLGNYDRTQTLTIDPVLSYATYFGGGGEDFIMGIAADGAGNVYVVGDTTSANYPTTTGAFRTTPVGSNDVVVTKLNAAGTAMIYSTYLGGSGVDLAGGIDLDASGNVYITGVTDSQNFPTRNAAFNSNTGFNDAFLAKLGPFGTNLLYSTYLGGGSDDSGNAIAVDNSGNAYIVGDTFSLGTGNSPFPTTQGAYQGNNSGGRDAFIAKFITTVSGSASVGYISFLGGDTDEKAEGVAVDGSGNAVVVGEVRDNTTVPPDLPTSNFPTLNAFQSTFNRGITDPYTAGYSDAFVTKFNSAGSGLLFSTFLGGDSDDCATGVTMDSAGKIFVLGETSSLNFPTQNAAQPIIGGGIDNDFPAQDAFIAEFQSNGTALVYSTFIGGSGYESGFQTYRSGIAVDKFGYIYIAGWTDSLDDFPLTVGADQTNSYGPSDAFVVKINPAISGPGSLIYSSFLGGDGGDRATCCAVDTNGLVYVAGFTDSTTNFPTTPGVIRPNHSGGFYDGWVAKLIPPADLSVSMISTLNPVIVGTNLTFNIQINNNGNFVFHGVTNTVQIASNFALGTITTSAGNFSVNGNKVTFNIGTLSNNVAVVQSIALTSISPGPTTNTALLSSIETPVLEPNTGNNLSTILEVVRGAADVTLAETAPGSVFISSNLVYTFGVTNKGFWPATALSLSNTLPANLTFVSATISPTNQGSFFVSGQNAIFDLGTLQKGSGATVTITALPIATGVANLIGTVTAFELDPNLPNNSASSSVTINGLAELALGQTASSNQVYAGNNITYSISVTNRGPTPSTDVLISDLLPAGVSLISATPSAGGTISNNAGVVYSSWSSVPSNGVVSLALTLRPSLAGTMTNTAAVTALTTDPVPSNNSVSVATTVIASSDLSLTQNASPSTVLVSTNITFTIVLTNRGPSSASSVTVTDPVPQSFSVVSVQSSVGTCSYANGVLTCSIGNFANNASATITLVARPGLEGNFINTAAVSSSTSDPNNVNDSASASVTVNENPLAPVLKITQIGTNVVLSWSTNADTFRLQVAPVLNSDPAWVDVPNVPVVVGKQFMVTNAIGNGNFYRLIQTSTLLSASFVPPNRLVVSWPSTAPGGILKRANSLASNAVWSTVGGTPVLSGNRYYVTNPVSGNGYFRLYY